MRKWYGQCAIGKVDIQAAFDAVPWGRLLHSLLKRRVPESLAFLVIQSQMFGFRLVWGSTQSADTYFPTRGSR
eukprot:6473299-Amphidinium_carterae.1